MDVTRQAGAAVVMLRPFVSGSSGVEVAGGRSARMEGSVSLFCRSEQVEIRSDLTSVARLVDLCDCRTACINAMRLSAA